METRSNQIIVGAVVLGLMVGLVFFLIWLSQPNRSGQKSYDILFTQSVGGLTKGAQVTYSGVPVGQVDLVELDRRNPEVIRVQITINDTVPVLAPTRESQAQNNPDGTTASLSQVGFTGPIQVELNTPRSLAPGRREPLATPGPYGNPLIPTKAGGFAAILNNAPEVLEQFRQLAARLTDFFSEQNQRSIAQILENTASITKSLGDRGPEIAATLAEARNTLREASISIQRFGSLANTTDRMLTQEGTQTFAALRRTLQSAQSSLQELETTIGAARPGIQTFSERTLPEVGALLRDLRATSESLRNVTQRLDQNGLPGLLGNQPLPDYRPQGR
jgi:phospholipid/cholesterol/gamma-HCH transport system substrate-binding protein